MNDQGFEIVEVSKTFDKSLALDRLSVQLPRGPHVAILGPSGSGKSTLLRLLAGLEAPSVGKILLDGKILSTPGRIVCPPHQRRVAMVFQDLALWPNLTTRDNIRLGLSGLRLGRKESMRRTVEAMEICGIADLSDRRPNQLSGGQQQRTALARAIAVRPSVLLLDEPLSAIDLALKLWLLKEIYRLAADFQFQVLLVSHDPWEATSLCENAIILDQGALRVQGNLQALLSSADWEPCPSYRKILNRH